MIPDMYTSALNLADGLPGKLTFRWHRQIREISAPWAECFGESDVLRSYKFNQAVEDAQLEDVEVHYLVGEDEKGVACLVPCFSYKVGLVSVAKPWVQRTVGWMRKLFPQFLYIRLFVVGSPVSTCGDLLGLKDLSDARRWNDQKIKTLFKEIIRKSSSLRIKFLLIKEFEAEVAERLRTPLAKDFFFVESLPTTYLTLPSREQGVYSEAIRSKYRNKLKKRKSVGAQNNLTWEIVPTCKGQEAAIYGLYQQVLKNSDFVFERLNSNFFSQVDRTLGDHSFFVLGYRLINGEKKMVACELVVCDSTTLHPLYSGFDYWVKRDSDLYFNAFYTIIEESERRGLGRVHLGQTAYEVKAELGATCTHLFLGVHHSNPLMRQILWMIRKHLFPIVHFPDRDVFAQPPPKRVNRAPSTKSSVPAGK